MRKQASAKAPINAPKASILQRCSAAHKSWPVTDDRHCPGASVSYFRLTIVLIMPKPFIKAVRNSNGISQRSQGDAQKGRFMEVDCSAYRTKGGIVFS